MMRRFSGRKVRRPSEVTVSPAGMRIVRLLIGTPPKTVAQLIKATGVTRTAVTEQLNELVAGGFVERATERLSGRGRPRHLYTATDDALSLLFAGDQRLLVPAIFQAISDIGGSMLRRKVLRRVSRKVANHYRQQINGATPQKRMTQLTQLLREEGGLVDIEKRDGRWVMRKRSCPFLSMFEQTRSVCWVDHEVLNLVLGVRVDRTSYRHDGDPCCSFTLKTTKRRK